MRNSKLPVFQDQRIHLTYDDVSLVTGLSTVSSRSDVDTSSKLPKGFSLELPIMTAAMDTITSSEMAKTILDYGAAIVHHRNQTIGERVKLLLENADHPKVKKKTALNGVAIGLNECVPEVIEDLIGAGANMICLELAHAWHIRVADAILDIGPICKEKGILLMVGNFSDVGVVSWLKETVGNLVDIIKVGQGAGSCCTTRLVTGIGKPGWQSIIDMTSSEDMPYYVVADGGIRNSGQLAKALGAGACAGMLGGMLSGTTECPGQIITDKESGAQYKEFRGMASSGAKGSTKNVEGISTRVPYKGSVTLVLDQIRDGLRSSVSCCGFEDLESFQKEVQFIKVSVAAKSEAVPHAIYL